MKLRYSGYYKRNGLFKKYVRPRTVIIPDRLWKKIIINNRHELKKQLKQTQTKEVGK